MPTEDQLDISLESLLEFKPDQPQRSISPELRIKIEKSAKLFAAKRYNYPLTEYGQGMKDGYAEGFKVGAELFALFQEELDRMSQNLKYISSQLGKIQLNDQNIRLVQEANNAINFAMAGASYSQSVIQNPSNNDTNK